MLNYIKIPNFQPKQVSVDIKNDLQQNTKDGDLQN